MYKYLRSFYFLIPFKCEFYHVLRKVYSPEKNRAGYLKFIGNFSLGIEGTFFKIRNNNLTIPMLLFWKGINGYEPKTLTLWRRLSENANVVFDVGANFGLFGLISKAVSSNSSVYCFEPLKRNIELIKINNELNGFDINFQCIALSNIEGSITFFDMDSYDNTIGSFNKDFINRHGHHAKLIPIKVPTMSLDRFVESNSINKIDLIKIDVEGHEFEVLQGAQNVIQPTNPDC